MKHIEGKANAKICEDIWKDDYNHPNSDDGRDDLSRHDWIGVAHHQGHNLKRPRSIQSGLSCHRTMALPFELPVNPFVKIVSNVPEDVPEDRPRGHIQGSVRGGHQAF